MMQNLLEEFWKADQKKIIRRQFIPFIFYLIFSCAYFYYGLRTSHWNPPAGDEGEEGAEEAI